VAAGEGGGAVGPAPDGLDALLYKPTDPSKRGIPEAVFIDNVEALCRGRQPQEVVAKLQELYSKYQYMQSSLAAQKSALKTKLPDIVSALETVEHLIDRRDRATEEGEDAKPVEYTYQLSETLWSHAMVPPTNVVCLWLGANCMLEYTLDEAIELLRTNEANARTTLKSIEEDSAFLRDQITTTEVNIARTHNYNVKCRQKLKEQAAAQTETPAPAAAAATLQPASAEPAASRGREASAGAAYSWSQESEEVEVSVKMPKGAQKTEVKVVILADSLRIEHSGKVFLEGELAGRCSPDGSTWTMNSGRVEVTLEKAESTQWPSLFQAEEA